MPSGTSENSTEQVLNKSGLKLFTRRFKASQDIEVKAGILLVHGFSWHSEYFTDFAQELAAQGFVVQTFDLQGHGRSEDCLPGRRGYVRSFGDHLDDIEQQLSLLQSAAPGRQVFVFGESMGGLLVLLVSLRKSVGPKLAGLVLSAPVVAVSPAVLPPWPVVIILRWLAKFFPRLPLPSHKIRDGHLEAFGNRELALQSLQDPYVLLNPPTLGFLDGVLGATEALQQQLRIISLPLLVLHGTEDTRVQLEYSQRLHDSASSNDKKFLIYPAAKHQLLQDLPSITETVIRDITQWLLARV